MFDELIIEQKPCSRFTEIEPLFEEYKDNHFLICQKWGMLTIEQKRVCSLMLKPKLTAEIAAVIEAFDGYIVQF